MYLHQEQHLWPRKKSCQPRNNDPDQIQKKKRKKKEVIKRYDS